MKRSIVLPLLGVALVVAAGGGYAAIKYRHDPLRDGRALLAKGDLRGASIELRTAVRDAPQDREAHFALAQLHVRMNDAVAAEKELRAAAELGYDPVKLRPALAQTYLDQQKFKELLADFPVPQGGPDAVVPILIARGLAMFAMKDAAGAVTAISSAEQLDPNNPDAPFAAARIAFAGKNMALAEQKIDRTIALSPHLPQARVVKAEILAARGARAAAIEQLDQALADAPRFASAHLERANLFILTGDDAKATADVEAVLADGPTNSLAIYLDAVLKVRKKDFAAANVDLQKISPVLTRFPRALYFDAVVKANLGQSAQATDSATRYVAQNGGDIDGVKLLARIHLNNHRPDLAADVLGKAAEAGRADAEILDLLGQAYALTGKGPEALKTYAQAAELAPNSPDILTRLATTRLGMGDAGGATADLQRSLAIDPKQANVGEALVVTGLAAGNLDQARTALEKLHAAQGDTEVVGNLAGLLKVADLDLEGARTQFQTTLAAFPDSVTTRINLIKITGMLGKRGEAEAGLTELAEKQPSNELAVFAFVGAMIEDNRVPRAIEALQKAHEAAPTNVNFTVALADLYTRSKDIPKALAVLDAAARTQASIPVLLGARARAQIAAGNTKDAAESFRKILAVNGGDLDARAKLVDLLMNTDDVDGAKAVLRDGLRLSPGNLSIMEALVRAEVRAGGIDSALAAADQLALDPSNQAFARVLKGDLYAGVKRFDKAAEAYSAELQRDPSSLLMVRYAVVLNLGGKPDQAIDAMRGWVSQHPSDLDAIVPLATLELVAKRYKDAAGHLETVIAARPNDAAAINNLAWLYQKLGDGRALALARRAYVIAPTPDTADTYGWLLAADKQADKAEILLRQAASKAPGNGIILYHLATVQKDLGQTDEATRNLTSAVALPGEFEEKDAAKKLLAALSAPR